MENLEKEMEEEKARNWGTKGNNTKALLDAREFNMRR